MLAVLVLAFYLLTKWLDSYTNHGQKQEVPDLVGFELSAAQKIADDQNLLLVVIDTLYRDNVPPGAIIDHTPSPGKFVKENRTIYISVNSNTPIMISMPKAYDVSLRQAKYILERKGLKLGRVEYKPDVIENYVFGQSYNGKEIKEGVEIPRGAKIDLIVGKGSMNTKIPTPSIIGLNYKTALTTLDSLGVTYNPIFSENEYKDDKDSANAIVWKQSPTPINEEEMMLSQTLDFWVAPLDTTSTINNSPIE